MCDGASRTNIFAASAKHYASARIFYNGSLFSLYFFGCESFYVAKVYAFSAAYAFFIVDFWTPRYLVSGNTVICFFLARSYASVLCFYLYENIAIFKYLYI